MKQNAWQPVRWLVLLVVFAAGCGGLLGTKGLPNSATLLGSGQKFSYTPLEAGRMFVVRDREVVLMRPLNKGEEFRSVEPGPGEDPQLFLKNEYYFAPGTK